jgi:hypothetical protein
MEPRAFLVKKERQVPLVVVAITEKGGKRKRVATEKGWQQKKGGNKQHAIKLLLFRPKKPNDRL